MRKTKDLSEMPQEVETLYLEEEELLSSSIEWGSFINSYDGFYKSAFNASLPFDPRFNAVHWGFAVGRLCREIVYGYCWMNAHARQYKSQTPPATQPANVHFHASYFADNTVTRIDSCRDKIALMVWAFYCPFNPERRQEILDYGTVLDRLKHPLRFGLALKDSQGFINCLEMLCGQDFTRMETYRNLKIHRMEPRIEIYGVKPHHGWDYMFPLYEQNEIIRWERELEKLYPDPEFRKRIAEGCYIDGVLFNMRKIKNSLWNYDEVKEQMRSCLAKLLRAAAGCFDILRSRPPLRKKQEARDKSGILVNE